MSFRIDYKLFVVKDDDKISIIILTVNLFINYENTTSFHIDYKLFVVKDDDKIVL
jgi:hypothetical protein